MNRKLFLYAGLIVFISLFENLAFAQTSSEGIFDSHSDVGKVKRSGNAQFDLKTQHYTVSGAGKNMWLGKDEFHFVWKKMKGDFILRTNAVFIGKETVFPRKLGLMVRSTLDSSSPHVSAVLHGNGLTSLQFRRAIAANTEEIKASIASANVIQLERKGKNYTMSAARKGETFVSQKLDDLDLGDEVYVGLFVCSHNADVPEKAVFSNVRIVVPAPPDLVPYRQYLGSALEILDLATLNSTIIYQTPGSIQAPNWNKDGKSLIYNSKGSLYQFDLASKTPHVLSTGPAKNNNNDHTLSFDGKMLVISSGEGVNGQSVGYVGLIKVVRQNASQT